MIYTVKYQGKYLDLNFKFTVTDINLCRHYTNKSELKKQFKKKDGYSVHKIKVHYRPSTCPWVTFRDQSKNNMFIGEQDIDYTYNLYSAWWCASPVHIQQTLKQFPNVTIQPLAFEEGEEI